MLLSNILYSGDDHQATTSTDALYSPTNDELQIDIMTLYGLIIGSHQVSMKGLSLVEHLVSKIWEYWDRYCVQDNTVILYLNFQDLLTYLYLVSWPRSCLQDVCLGPMALKIFLHKIIKTADSLILLDSFQKQLMMACLKHGQYSLSSNARCEYVQIIMGICNELESDSALGVLDLLKRAIEHILNLPNNQNSNVKLIAIRQHIILGRRKRSVNGRIRYKYGT
ncbi:unnamed protein product [Rotaria socialis]|uniref:Uncharacterized protein n=1 Tax=Rotaria socialis TaxID=392032 RepID=A0A820QG57_9BILA|nr:unnamed protein product [Rotaria socialis]